MRHKPFLKESKLWENNENLIWLGTTINLSRNLEKYNFPSKLDEGRQKQIISLINKEFVNNSSGQKLTLISAQDIDYIEKEFLSEHYLSNQQLQNTHSGEAFVIDDSGHFLATINLKDHLNLTLIDCQGELENSWNQLIKIETSIGEALPFAFHSKFGFLTADPMLCGTALTITAFLQIPALIHLEKIDEILEAWEDENITVTGIQGSPTEIVGDVLAIKNQFTLGVNEETILSSIRNFTTKIILEENTALKEIREADNTLIKDHISRAYGILMHSYQIEAIEALNALSQIKLGIELGWVKGMTLHEINQVFFNSRRAHLIRQFNEKISQEELSHKRAEYIHKKLKKAKLAF